jgi:hypothetical protein
MPIKLKIVDGPPFKKIIQHGSLFSDDTWDLGFTLVDSEKQALIKKSLSVSLIGRQTYNRMNEDEHAFIGCATGGIYDQDKNLFGIYYFAGTYNTTTREGSCEMMTPKEFFSSALARLIFPNEAEKVRKYNAAEKNGTYDVVYVAIECSTPAHQALFEREISAHERAVITRLNHADVVITDCPTERIEINMLDRATLILYAAKVEADRKRKVLNLDTYGDKGLVHLADVIHEISNQKKKKA